MTFYMLYIYYRYCPPDQTSRDSPSYHRGTSYADSDSSRSASPVADTLEFITNLGDGDTEEQSCNPQSNDTLPPHLRLGTISSAASWYVNKYNRSHLNIASVTSNLVGAADRVIVYFVNSLAFTIFSV